MCHHQGYKVVLFNWQNKEHNKKTIFDWCVLRREWMGCWGLLGWWLVKLVMTGIIPCESRVPMNPRDFQWHGLTPGFVASLFIKIYPQFQRKWSLMAVNLDPNHTQMFHSRHIVDLPVHHLSLGLWGVVPLGDVFDLKSLYCFCICFHKQREHSPLSEVSILGSCPYLAIIFLISGQSCSWLRHPWHQQKWDYNCITIIIIVLFTSKIFETARNCGKLHKIQHVPPGILIHPGPDLIKDPHLLQLVFRGTWIRWIRWSQKGRVVTWNMAETWLKLSLLRKCWRENDWKLDLRWYDDMWSSSLLFFFPQLSQDGPSHLHKTHSWGQNPHRCPQLWKVISQMIPHGIYKTIVIIGYKTIEVGHR